MFCPSCGSPNGEQNRFCLRCGKPLPAVSITSSLRKPPPSRGPVNVPVLPIAVAAVLVVLLAGGLAGYGRWHQAQQEAAYTRGATAYAESDWEQAAAAFQSAGSYLDSPTRLQQAQEHVAQVLPLYTQAQDYRKNGQWLEAAINLRQVVEQAPKFRNAPAQLAEARSHTGSLLYTTQSGSEETLWLAPADGGSPKELVTSAAPTGTLSPDGKWLLVTTGTGNGDDSLYVFNADGSNRRDLGSGKQVDLVRFSQDGQRLAYVVTTSNSNASNTTTTFVADLATAQRHQVAAGTSSSGTYAWDFTPDLTKADVSAYNSESGNSPFNLTYEIVDTASGKEQRLAQGVWSITHCNPVLSPDGARALTCFDAPNDNGTSIALVDAPTGKRLDLGAAQSFFPGFSTDGKQLLLFRQVTNRLTGELVLVNVLDGTQKVVSDSLDPLQPNPVLYNADAAFSTIAQTSLAFFRTSGSVQGSGQDHGYLVDLANGAMQEIASGDSIVMHYAEAPRRMLVIIQNKRENTAKLTVIDPLTLDRHDVASGESVSPYVSPDGKRLAVAVTASGTSNDEQLMIMAPNGSNASPIAEAASIEGAAFSADGSHIAYSSAVAFNATPSLYIATVDGAKKQLIVNGGRLVAWLAPPAAAAAK